MNCPYCGVAPGEAHAEACEPVPGDALEELAALLRSAYHGHVPVSGTSSESWLRVARVVSGLSR